MSGFLSGRFGTWLWSTVRAKTPVDKRDDLERALRKGAEVVARENAKDCAEATKDGQTTPVTSKRPTGGIRKG